MKSRHIGQYMFIILMILSLGFLQIPSAAAAAPLSLKGEKMSLEVRESPFSLQVLDAQGREMLATDGPFRFTKVTGQESWRFILWFFWTKGLVRPWQEIDRVTAVRPVVKGIELDLGHQNKTLARLTADFDNDRALKVTIQVLDRPGVNRIKVSFKRDHDDRYYGMGERFNRVEHTGEKVRNWCEEGGLGLFNMSRVFADLPFDPLPKGQDMTYYPVPFFLNPDKGYGFLLDSVHYSIFDFGKSGVDSLLIENWDSNFDFRVFYGPAPLAVIEAQTAATGRIKIPQPWVFAPMNAAVEGEPRVREVAALVRKEKIPTSAIWSEDWWWREEFEVNRERYPDYEGMIADLHRDGFRHLSYYQPYIDLKVNAYREGDSHGYFIKDKKGKTYPVFMGFWTKAQLDLTNPAAGQWWQDKFFTTSERMGVDGWMHDFGEHVQPDAVLYDGRSGWDVHNEYPLLWLKLARDFWDKARPDGDYCFYVRAGYTGAQKYASVMWTGDQNTNFEKYDGLPSNIPAILSVGISGHPIGTTDIAGYNCFVSKSTDQELFMRWTELGAMLPVMRIHRGNDEICNNWSFDENRETLEHYKKYAILHTSLFPYIYTLVSEAAERGWPVVRHLMLHYPEDRQTWHLDYEFLLGDRILVAPVLERHARKWEVYLPEGQWAHWWSGKIYQGPGKVKVEAGLGEEPIFVMTGKILPQFDSQIDTLVKEDRTDLNGWDDANASLKVTFYGQGQDEYKLWDGTIIKCERKSKDQTGTCEFSGAPLVRKYTTEFK